MKAVEERLEERSELFSTLSLYWLIPDEELWNDLGNKEFVEQLITQASDVYQEEFNGEALLSSIPSFKEAKRFTEHSINISFGSHAAGCIESLYKPWTADPDCNLQMAREKNYVMGDSAYYMKEVLEKLEIEIPENIMPDHLAVELDLFSILIASAPREDVKDFASNHLDWLGDFQEKLAKVSDQTFYLELLTFIEQLVAAESRL